METKARLEMLREWKEQAEAAVEALEKFKFQLECWEAQVERDELVDELGGAILDLSDSGLGDWIDGNPLDVDKLATMLETGEVEDGEPKSIEDMLSSVFGS